MRHAYLIAAHNEFAVLQKLVEALDDERNDIYIHFDKKVKALPELRCEKSGLYVLDDESRVDVRWGSVSQIEMVLQLLEVSQRDRYAYRHLISGVHLPLKSQDEIHRTFDALYPQNVLRLWTTSPVEVAFKLQRYHFFLRNYKHRNPFVLRADQRLWQASLFAERKLHIHRNQGRVYRKSDVWCSLTEAVVNHLLANWASILKEYRYAFCADEYFVASEIFRHPGAFSLCDMQRLLCVDFYRANPICYTADDYDRVMSSGCLFARKFTARHMDVVEKIVAHVTGK